MYRFIKNIRILYQHITMRWFSSPEKFIKWYLTKNGGCIELEDKTFAVNQSNEFHAYCYGDAYKTWEKNKK